MTTTPNPATKKPAPQVTQSPKIVEKSTEQIEIKEDISLLTKYQFVIMVGVTVLFLISFFINVFFIFDVQTLETKVQRLENRLRAAVFAVCKIDIASEPKAVSFVWEENDDGDKVLVLKCEPVKKVEKN